MNILDVCAGIGSFSEAGHRAGMTSVCQIEIEPTRQAVLSKHFPNTLRLDDLREVTNDDITKTIDIICGGTPCQNLSIAGHGEGLVGKRSGLWFDYLRLARELQPRWLVWENVPNALSSNRGRDFRKILRGLDECGYHVAWRVLDAQYFGVPQRRRRIFLVGHLGDGRAAQVLFERESLPGNSTTRPTQREDTARIAGTLSKSASGTARTGNGNETDMLVIQPQGASAYDARNHRLNGDISGTLQAKKSGGYSLNYQNPIVVPAHSFRMRGFGDYVEDDFASALKKRDGKDATDLIAFNPQASSTSHQIIRQGDYTGALSKTRREGIFNQHIIRRLTPTECARLQGFDDDWLEGLGLSDTKKYEMWGDTIALPCSEWIMKRIAEIDSDSDK